MGLAVVKWWRKYVASVGWPINSVFLACVVIVILHDFALSGSPELFQNAGKIWELLYKLALSLLASYVFFYINIHLPKLRDRENLHPFLNTKTFRIVDDASKIVGGLRYASGHDNPKDYFPSLPDLKTMCSKVHPYSDSNMYFGDVGRNANWMERLDHYRKQTKEAAESIYAKTPFIKSEYLKLVMDVDDSEYFLHLPLMASARLENEDISFLADDLYDYLQKVQRLSNYAHREFGENPYGEEYHESEEYVANQESEN